MFTGKHLCSSLFLIKLQTRRPATLLKRDSNTCVFLCIFYRTSLAATSNRRSECKDLADLTDSADSDFNPHLDSVVYFQNIGLLLL